MKLISFEGSDYSGKTTTAKLLAEKLDKYCPKVRYNSGTIYEGEELNYIGVVSPIRIHPKNSNLEYNIINEKVSNKLQKFNFDSVPILNRLATYYLVLARKI